MGCGSSAQSRYVPVDVVQAAQSDQVSAKMHPVAAAGHAAVASSAPQPPKCPRDGTDLMLLPEGLARLTMGEFRELRPINKSPAAVVYCLANKTTGRLFAGKRIHRDHILGLVPSKDYQHEVYLLHALSKSPGVIDVYGVAQTEYHVWIVHEFCGGGCFGQWLAHFPKSTRDASRQLVDAVQHLHSLLICHLEIEPDNVMFDDNGKLRLAGFTRARQLSASGELLSPMPSPVGDSDGVYFQAPELSHGEAFCGIRADTYSLGRTLQVAIRADASWEEAVLMSRRMIVRDPTARVALSTAYSELFGGRHGAAIVSKAERAVFEIDRQMAFEPWKYQEAEAFSPTTSAGPRSIRGTSGSVGRQLRGGSGSGITASRPQPCGPQPCGLFAPL